MEEFVLRRDDDVLDSEISVAEVDVVDGNVRRVAFLRLHALDPRIGLDHRPRALLNVPEGSLATYGQIAQAIGMPRRAARAVGTAVGANPISWLIPCHRVIRETGALGGYHWGLGRKLAMLGWEANLGDRETSIDRAG